MDIIRYTEARWEERRREEAYRVYVTDTLRLIASREGYIKQRYAELINPNRKEMYSESAEEIIAKVVKNAGLSTDTETETGHETEQENTDEHKKDSGAAG